MSNQRFDWRKHFWGLSWFFTSQMTHYNYSHKFAILKRIIVGKVFVRFRPLEGQLEQLVKYQLAYLVTHIFFLAAGALLIWLSSVVDAALAERCEAAIATFWPLQHHFTNLTNELWVNGLASANLRIHWNSIDSKVGISDTVLLLFQINVVDAVFLRRDHILCLFNHMTLKPI